MVRIREFKNLVFARKELRESYAIEEKVEFFSRKGGKILAMRVWLPNVRAEFPEEPPERIASACLSKGWSLSATDGIPWIYRQFTRAQGDLKVFDWIAEVFVTERYKRICEIEVWMRGAPDFLHF